MGMQENAENTGARMQWNAKAGACTDSSLASVAAKHHGALCRVRECALRHYLNGGPAWLMLGGVNWSRTAVHQAVPGLAWVGHSACGSSRVQQGGSARPVATSRSPCQHKLQKAERAESRETPSSRRRFAVGGD